MIRAILPLVLLASLGSCAQQGPSQDSDPLDTTRAAARPDPLADARSLMEQGRVDDAMIAADAILAERPKDAGARLFRAHGSIALFDAGRQPGQVFLQDAVRDLEVVLDQNEDDPEALSALAWCKLKLGEFEDSREAALRAAEARVAEGAPFDKVSAAFLQAADAEMQIFADVRRAELAAGVERPSDDSHAAANRVLTLLKSAEQKGPVPKARVRTAQVYQWMNRGLDAVEALEEGLRAMPDSNEMHQAFQDAYWAADMRRECVSAYKRLLDETSSDGAMRYYLGRAQVALADDLRRKSDQTGAQKAYRDALQTFRAYDSTHRSERTNTGIWIAICELSLGRLAYERGELDEAAQHYAAAFDASPLVAQYDAQGMPRVYDSFGGNYFGGLGMVGQAIAEHASADALRDTLAFYESVLSRHEGGANEALGAMYNNAALAARDLGAQVVQNATDAEREVATREAMALWERSYRYYEKAVELSPDDARIVNDTGLMLVYHLRRDHDRARELFDEAIVLGEAALAELPEDAPVEQRQQLEEVVGDAWQNIGVMLSDNLGRPMSEARPFLEKAVRYYPYERREAASMLRRTQGQQSSQGALKAKFENAVGPAREHAEAGDWDSALLVLDKASKDEELREYAPFRALYGQYSLSYAEAAAAAGRPSAGNLFLDAIRHLERAVELDPDPAEPRLMLARALLAAGEAQRAAQVSGDLLSHLRSSGTADPEIVRSVHAVRAPAAARAYVQQKQEGGDPEELLREARTSFREIEETEAFDDATRTLWITMERWAGADEQAIEIAIRAWRRAPEQQVGALVQLGAETATSDRVTAALEGADDAVTTWWNARAHFDLAQQQWAGGESAAAAQSLDEAVTLFERAMAANESFRDSSEQWAALSLGSKALVLAAADDVDGARKAVLEALERRPDVFENDLGGGASIKRAVLVVGDKLMKAGKLGEVAEFYRRVGSLVPRDVDVANNEGLFTRDWADRLEREGKGEAAREFSEASYAAYTRASELDPENVRLLNDRALLLVYQLGRDLDLAVELLNSAIEKGEAQLANDPPSEPRQLRDLQEAVGDAYGNLGTYHMRYSKDLDAAKANFEKSLEFWPFEQRAGTRELQRIERMQQEAQPQDGEPR